MATGAQGACYHNAANASDYARLGRAEVVEVLLPPADLERAFQVRG